MSIFANIRKFLTNSNKKKSRRSGETISSEVQQPTQEMSHEPLNTTTSTQQESTEMRKISQRSVAPPNPSAEKTGRLSIVSPLTSVEVTQEAYDVRDGARAILVMEDLRLHSNGVFSNVYRGKLVQPLRLQIAVKKTWPSSSHRNDEMIFLAGMRRVNPRNIIKLLYKFTNKSRDGVTCESFVFVFLPDTLHTAIKTGLDMIDVKIYTWQLFNGLDFLAANHIAHRDIKPVNILVNPATGELQIGDFGSAKVIRRTEKSTAYQVTRYYRPPELLLGAVKYDWMIDVWSGGCVLGEMLKGTVLFCGKNSKNQMKLIVDAFGPPTKEQLVDMKLSPDTEVHADGRGKGNKIAQMLPNAPKEAVDLLRRILVYSPKKRCCGRALLNDAFFEEVLSNECTRVNGQLTCEILERQPDDVLRPYPFKKLLKQRNSAVPKCPEPGDDAGLSPNTSGSRSHITTTTTTSTGTGNPNT